MTHNNEQIRFWQSISFSAGIVFFLLMFFFLLVPELPWVEKQNVISNLALRITLLLSVGGYFAFSLKFDKSNIHMREHNLHRLTLANSIEDIVGSAAPGQQQDMIFSKIIEAFVEFNSGLGSSKDTEGSTPQKMFVEY